MGAIIFKVPPHLGHCSMSISNNRYEPRGRQDSHASGLVRPGTAPSTGAGLRSIPTGLIPAANAFPSALPCTRVRGRNVPNRAPRTDESPASRT
jgi:hypothetical protein